MGGGRGTRLYPLTKKRSKPAVPLVGKYRLIDVPVSNCLHSDIDKIAILTQFNSVSLHRQIFQTYRRDMFTGGWVQIWAAEQTRYRNWRRIDYRKRDYRQEGPYRPRCSYPQSSGPARFRERQLGGAGWSGGDSQKWCYPRQHGYLIHRKEIGCGENQTIFLESKAQNYGTVP